MTPNLARPLSADHCVIACRAMDATYVRVGGKWRYLWRGVDQHGRLIDFRRTARRDAKAARAFFRQACARVASLHGCFNNDPTKRVISAASGTAFVNGIPAARSGDAISCGGFAEDGSDDVEVGD